MIVGLMTVLIVIVYRVTSDTGSTPVAAAQNEIALPANAAIIDTALSGDRVMLTLELPDGRRQIQFGHAARMERSARAST